MLQVEQAVKDFEPFCSKALREFSECSSETCMRVSLLEAALIRSKKSHVNVNSVSFLSLESQKSNCDQKSIKIESFHRLLNRNF